MITPEQWRIIEPLLDAALELPESARLAWVAQQCPNDAELQSALSRLLASIADTDSEFDQLAKWRRSVTPDEHNSGDHADARVIAERFRIEEEIGRGVVGVVYRAYDERVQRRVAIRVLKTYDTGRATLERFSSNVRLTAALRHPNIVPLFDFGESDEAVYFVMPLIDGETLRDHLALATRMPVPEVQHIMSGVLAALEYAHSTGVIHLDVKPSNILLSHGEVLLADFGVARLSAASDSDLTDSSVTIGSPIYMSPEQGDANGVVDHRSDIYSAGCVLIEALTGQRPIPASQRRALAAQDHDLESRRLTRQLTERPALLRCSARAIALQPADRFQSAREFAEALSIACDAPLERAVAKVPEAAVGAGPSERPRARIEAIALLVSLCSLVVIIGAIARRERSMEVPTVDLRPVTVFPLAPRDTSNHDVKFAEIVKDAFLQVLLYSQTVTPRDGTRLPIESEGGGASSDHARLVARTGGGTYIDGTWWRDDSIHVRYVVHRDGRPPVTHLRTWPLEAPADIVGAAAARSLQTTLGQPAMASGVPSQTGQPFGLGVTGLQAYRASRYAEAVTRFRQLNESSPTYQSAALLGAEAASWIDQQQDARILSRIALNSEMAGVESARMFEMIRGFDFFTNDRADSALVHLHRVVSRDVLALEAWLALATIHDRLLPHYESLSVRVGTPDVLTADALAHARTIDPDFLPALYPQLVESVRTRDTVTARALLQRLTAHANRLGTSVHFGTQSVELRAATLIVRCAASGASSAPWDSVPVDAVVEAARALTASGLRRPQCALAAWQHAFALADPEFRWKVLQGLQTVLLARGQTAAALRLIDSDTTVGATQRGWLAITDALAEPDPGLRARATVATNTTRSLFASNPAVMSDEALWYLGLWLTHESRITEARAVHDTLLGRVTLSSNELQRHFEQSLAARLALARGDTANALVLLTALTPIADRSTLTWTPSAGQGADRLLLAEVLLAQRKFADASAVASYFDSGASVTYPIFLWRSLQIRGVAASARSDRTAYDVVRQRQRVLRPASIRG